MALSPLPGLRPTTLPPEDGGPPPLLLFYAAEMEAQAQAVVAGSGGTVELMPISWRRFNDGWPNLFLHDVDRVRKADVAFLASFHAPDVVFAQVAVIYALAQYLSRTLKIIVPYFPTSTFERVEQVGEVATADTLARLLSACPACATGPPQVCIFDIHALQTRFYFNYERVGLRLKSCVSLLLRRLESLARECAPRRLVVAFPDDGAHKRYKAKFPGFDLVICQKVRDGDRRIVTVKEGAEALAGNHVVIVDDLVQTGGTLLEAAKALKQEGADQVSAYVTHAIFPNGAHTKFLGDAFTHFFTTDSVPTTANVLRDAGKPFEIFSIADIVTVVLDR